MVRCLDSGEQRTSNRIRMLRYFGVPKAIYDSHISRESKKVSEEKNMTFKWSDDSAGNQTQSFETVYDFIISHNCVSIPGVKSECVDDLSFFFLRFESISNDRIKLWKLRKKNSKWWRNSTKTQSASSSWTHCSDLVSVSQFINNESIVIGAEPLRIRNASPCAICVLDACEFVFHTCQTHLVQFQQACSNIVIISHLNRHEFVSFLSNVKRRKKTLLQLPT